VKISDAPWPDWVNASVALVAGAMLIVLVLQDAFEVMLLPRRVKRRYRFTSVYFRCAWAGWVALARVFSPGPRQERILSMFGPLSMTLLFAIWAIGLILGFGLVQWSAQQWGGFRPAANLAASIYLSGVTFFTLGYGDLIPKTPPAQFAAVLEAGVGFGLIAVVIGYLPVLYQLFSRREAHVIQLDGRAGSPPTATTLLTRHAEGDGLDKVDDLLRSWEVWGAELLESHLSYPMLTYYRSQHDDQSWLAALAALLDTCTLVLVGVEDVKPLQARMTFAMLRQVVLEMARSLRVSAPIEPRASRLSEDHYESMMAAFETAGLTWNGSDQSRETLSAVRATYEPLMQGLADYLITPLPGFVTDEDTPDHWERGPRGVIARRMIDGLAAGNLEDSAVPDAARRRARAGRLRDHLRKR
jgi:hypothetical protein